MNQLVSVLIPHYNRANLLAETLRSLRSQSYSNWEAIVVDDGSTEDVWAEIQEFARSESRVQFRRRTSDPKGPSKCRNLAMENARGEFVVFLDSDDLLAPWCLEQRVRQLNALPDNDFAVFPAMVFRSQPGDQNVLWNNLDCTMTEIDRFLRGTPPWCIASPVWRIESLRRIGGLNETLRYGEDAELHLRGILRGLTWTTFSDAAPDVFIRRGERNRFTSDHSIQLLSAKQTYIQQGFHLVQSEQQEAALVSAWERRYFEELEFLIYNVADNRHAIRSLLSDWEQNYDPFFFLRLLFQMYGTVGRISRRRAYLVLRICRRVVLALIPSRFRSPVEDRGFENAALTPARFSSLQDRLKAASIS